MTFGLPEPVAHNHLSTLSLSSEAPVVLSGEQNASLEVAL